MLYEPKFCRPGVCAMLLAQWLGSRHSRAERLGLSTPLDDADALRLFLQPRFVSTIYCSDAVFLCLQPGMHSDAPESKVAWCTVETLVTWCTGSTRSIGS